MNLQDLSIYDIQSLFDQYSVDHINEQFFPRLYVKDNKNKIRDWSVRLIPYGEYMEVNISYGVVDGKHQEKTEMITEGKNIGKKNETTPYTQAFIVARKYFNRQLDKGYVDSVDKIGTEEHKKFIPMSAQDYHKHSRKIRFPCLASPKLDGIRAVAKKTSDGSVVFTTKRGKEITSVDHLKEQLKDSLGEGEIIDGELYNHKISFQELTSKIRKQNQTDPNIEFHVFDYVSDEGYRDRQLNIVMITEGLDKVFSVPVFEVNSSSEIRELHDHYVFEGYEGLMVRNIDAPYEPGKRSYNIQKFKDFDDDEFEIIDVIEKKNNQGVFYCKTEDGKNEFSVRPKGSDEYREYILKNPQEFIGKMLTVRYFGYTEDGDPRFPVGIVVRDYE